MQIKNKAFTFVELMVVMLIISILSIISFIYLQEYTREVRDQSRKTYLNKLYTTIENYYLQNEKYPKPDNITTLSTQTGFIEGEIGESFISTIKDINLQKDPKTNLNYKYYLIRTGDRFKIEANLEDGGKYVVGNFKKDGVYVNKKTGYIFKYAGKRWPKVDPNCKLRDVEVYDPDGKLVQIWAGCNSTLGKGYERKKDGYDKKGNCWDYDGNKLSEDDCLSYDNLMLSNKSAKDYFYKVQVDGVNKNGDTEFDNIWGKGYDFEKSFTACPDGWKIPNESDWIFLLKTIGAIELNNSISSFNASKYGIINRENTSLNIPGKGRGWRSHNSFDTPDGNLASLLKTPLSGLSNSEGRGNYTGFRVSEDGEHILYLGISETQIGLYTSRYVSHNYSVRCIKEL